MWSGAVASPGAFGLRVHFDNFWLPPDTELYLFNAAGEDVETVVDRIVAATGRVDLVHCNDSRDERGSSRDRHANLGKGEIPEELIVGERGPSPKAVPTYPELTCHSLEDLQVLNSRRKVHYAVDDAAVVAASRHRADVVVAP